MRRHYWRRAATLVVAAAVMVPAPAAAQRGQDRSGVENRGWENSVDRRDDRPGKQRGTRGYQEPAYARGFSDGYQRGWDNGRSGDRYDPVRHGDYRKADQGYYGSYGSKDAYRNNYRAGFRPGYEEGYRDGTQRR